MVSTDERFRPVYTATGPDGALYVADMYRGIIEGHIFLTTFLRGQIVDRGLQQPFSGMGRIYDATEASMVSDPSKSIRDRAIAATRQLAKRQFTWLRSWTDLHWLDSLDCDNLPRALKYLGTISILS